MKPWKSRIVGHDTVAPQSLTAHDKNWRIHTPEQTRALAGVIGDIGYIRSVTVNRRTGRIIDGHLRVALAIQQGQEVIDVEYVDLSEAEEAEALATLDPLAGLAETDSVKLQELWDLAGEHDPALDALLDVTDAEETPEVPAEVEFSEFITESSNYVVLLFDNDIDWLAAMTHFGLTTKVSRLQNGKPGNRGIGRIVNGARYLNRIQEQTGHG